MLAKKNYICGIRPKDLSKQVLKITVNSTTAKEAIAKIENYTGCSSTEGTF